MELVLTLYKYHKYIMRLMYVFQISSNRTMGKNFLCYEQCYLLTVMQYKHMKSCYVSSKSF